MCASRGVHALTTYKFVWIWDTRSSWGLDRERKRLVFFLQEGKGRGRMQSLFLFKGTPAIFQQSLKFGHSRSICGKEIADGALSFSPQRCFDHSSISSIKSEGNRRERPRRSTNRIPKETGRSKDFSTSDEALKPSNQDAIIDLFKRIQSSISKDGSGASKRNLKSQKDKPTGRPMRQNQKHKQISDTPPRKDEDKELSGERGYTSEEATISNAAHVDAKVARPASNFVKRSPIPQTPTTNETSSNVLDEPQSLQNADEDSDLKNLNQMKLPKLKELAREKGVKGYSKMKKGELLELLKGLLSTSNDFVR